MLSVYQSLSFYLSLSRPLSATDPKGRSRKNGT